MKVTIDSSEPLENALRVLGAMYDVTLKVSPEKRAHAHERRAGRSGKPTVKARTTATESAPPGQKRSARRTRASRRSAERSASNAELRSWAKKQGYAVADRGRLPAEVVEAYRTAHGR